MDKLLALAEIVKGMNAEERRLVIEEMSVPDVEDPATPNLSFEPFRTCGTAVFMMGSSSLILLWL